MQIAFKSEKPSNQIQAANSMSWEDFNLKAKSLAKQSKFKTWEGIFIRRLKNNAKSKSVTFNNQKYSIKPGDLFMFMDSDDDTYLYIEDMKTFCDITQRTLDILWEASRAVNTSPSSRKNQKPKDSDTKTKPIEKPLPERSKKIHVLSQNINAFNSRFPETTTGKATVLTMESYLKDNSIGYYFTFDGGYMMYLIGVGPKVKNGELIQQPFAVLIDTKGKIHLSREPVDFKKPSLGLKMLKLEEKKLDYEEYVRYYKECSNYLEKAVSSVN